MSLRGGRYNPGMPVGNSTTFGATSSLNDENAEGLMQQFHQFAEKVDNMLGQVAGPIKPYLPAIGRFLIVVTFLEDAVRIVTQWGDQVHYMWNVRQIPYILSVLFLLINVGCMLAGSLFVITKKRLEYGIGALIFVVISQAVAYGLIFDFQFLIRNLSLIGGLLMALSDAFVRDRRSLSMPGLPMIDDKDKSKYLQLAGRIMLIFLFLTYVLQKRWTAVGSVLNILELAACILVVLGYKARFSASLLVILLSVQNVFTNAYWKYSHTNPTRDFLRYEHFQTLSIVGGLILVVSSGAGRLSIDEKKKIY